MMAPGSQEENDFVHSMIESSGSDHWIACSTQEKNGPWICSGNANPTYRPWAKDEPNGNGGVNCARMAAASGEWKDNSCPRLYFAVCIRDPIPINVSFRLKSWRLLASCLVGHVLLEFQANSINTCALECSLQPGCRSFNVLHYGEKICQLNDARGSDVDQDKFNQLTKPLCIYGEK